MVVALVPATYRWLCWLGLLAGWWEGFVLCPSMWSSHPTFTLSHPAEDRFPAAHRLTLDGTSLVVA